MKKHRLLLVLITFIFLFSTKSVQNSMAQTYPNKIRVGIYSGNSSVSNVSLEAGVGLEIGYYQNSSYTVLFTGDSGKQTICRKDAHFIKSPSGAIVEYNPNEGVPFAGETFGPYHIQIGDTVADLKSAQELCNVYRTNGIFAYPVLEKGWSVWTGFYSDSTKANEELPNISSLLGGVSLKVIEPSQTRIIVYSNTFEPRMIFGSTDVKLNVRPNELNNPELITVNGKQYRGEIELQRFADSDMTVINIVGLEQYLYGVVPKEIESFAPLEALKAQAVAARTYAYKSMGSYKKWDFDVVNTVSSQVYGGYSDEKESTNKAIDGTKGIKVLYNNVPASLFYYSSSGGKTEDNIYVWGSDIPYLKSVSDPYEAGNSYNYYWSRTFTAEDIKMKLFLSDVEIGNILSMVAEEYTPAGRVRKLKITGTEGSITYTNEDIRIILGDNGGYLPSRMFTINGQGAGDGTASFISAAGINSKMNVFGAKAVTSSGVHDILASAGPLKVVGNNNTSIITRATVSDGTFVLTGKGWGHGVGMSQEGAKGFARNGYTYDQILKHYYTGVTIE